MRAMHRYALERTAQFIGAKINMKARQEPLRQHYKTNSDDGWIVDSATTTSDEISTGDAIHGQVRFGANNPATQNMGVHSAVGGNCDDPNPGELLAAAIASCLDSTIRIIANRLGLPLRNLSVHVDAHVDVRGTLRVSREVPVGFQSIDITVDIDPLMPLSEDQIDQLIRGAERSCVVLQTIMNSPEINIKKQAA